MTAERKILFIGHDAGAYGAQRSLYTLVVNLAKRPGWEVAVVLPNEGPLSEWLYAANITTIVQPYRNWLTSRSGLVLRMIGLLRRIQCKFAARGISKQLPFQPDLVYSNTIANPLGVYLAEILNTKHIWHVRELVGHDKKLKFMDSEATVKQIAGRQLAGLMANSRFTSNESFACWFPNVRTSVVYNGFHLPENLESGEDRYQRCVATSSRPVLLMAGAVLQWKGHETAINAVSELQQRQIETELWIAGEGPVEEVARLKSLTRQLKVDKKVSFLGFRNDLDSIYRDAAILVIASTGEPFGRTAVEALARGIPVIGTIGGGVSEIVVEGASGWLYETGDFQLLSNLIEKTLLSKDIYAALSNYGQNDMPKRFSEMHYINSVVKEIDGLFEGR